VRLSWHKVPHLLGSIIADTDCCKGTGAAYCVGLVGLRLCGGHGSLEGLHGLVADGLVHLNVVLANGTEIGVNATSHADLFWAMKGAGHNFGIVTSFRAKIYPKFLETWHYHYYVWTGDKLEAVFEALNDLHVKENGTTPVLMSFETGIIAMDFSVSETEVSNTACIFSSIRDLVPDC
jgi:FAD/FMN-containing dehydrogenase